MCGVDDTELIDDAVVPSDNVAVPSVLKVIRRQ